MLSDDGFKAVLHGTEDTKQASSSTTKDSKTVDQDSTYSYQDIAIVLGMATEDNPDSIRKAKDTLSKWWNRGGMGAAYEYHQPPLRTVVGESKGGDPVYRFTQSGLEAFKAYKEVPERKRSAYIADIATKHKPAAEYEVIEAEIDMADQGSSSALAPLARSVTPGIHLNIGSINLWSSDDADAALEAQGNLGNLTAGIQRQFAGVALRVGKQMGQQIGAQLGKGIVEGIQEATIAHAQQAVDEMLGSSQHDSTEQ